MYVIKKRDFATVAAPITISNDADAVTGAQNAKFRGAKPNFATGAFGNAVNPETATYLDVQNTTPGLGNVIESIHSIYFNNVLPAQINYVSIPVTRLGITSAKAIWGVTIVGAKNLNPTAGANPTPDLIKSDVVNWHVTDEKITFIIPAANIALVQNKYLVFKVNSMSVGSI